MWWELPVHWRSPADRDSGLNPHCRQILFLQSAANEDECESRVK